ncbi:hypothetical protein B0E38_01841 [Streptomyces sp. 111WW2]|uniref:hypothetical protein n=1 Tax=Streptomyces sp. 111WW2 TaxID=1945515 RepID=UPI000D2E5D8C|nr:hypothetical protein [Streptomyces sp. 111WW2]PSK57996.1 hypothetical protein B0E38_01841 [Streptomyces sp. 111WW2]
MAKKTFALNTEPHVATVGERDLEFQPEVMGDEFMDALAELKEAQKETSGIDLDDLSTVDPDKLRGAARGLRCFLARLMLPASAALFTRLDVVKDGEVLKSFHDVDEANAHAEKVDGGARVVDAMRLPDRILIDLMEWVTELYGGGADERPPTSSGASAKPSPKGGRRGMGVSPSRVSKGPAAGR